MHFSLYCKLGNLLQLKNVKSNCFSCILFDKNVVYYSENRSAFHILRFCKPEVNFNCLPWFALVFPRVLHIILIELFIRLFSCHVHFFVVNVGVPSILNHALSQS